MSGSLYYQGKTFTVEWYCDAAGRMPAKAYYEDLPEEDQNRLDDIVAYMADSPIGTRLPKTLYNEEDSKNKIYAFKPRDHRFFNFMTTGKKIVILNAYRKHSQQMTKKDLNLLETTVAAKNDYLRRAREGG
jgi:hypothetical protein